MSRAWRVSARWLKDIAKSKEKRTASTAAWKLMFYEHPRPDMATSTPPQLVAMLCFSAWLTSLTRGMLLTPCVAKLLLHVAAKQAEACSAKTNHLVTEQALKQADACSAKKRNLDGKRSRIQ